MNKCSFSEQKTTKPPRVSLVSNNQSAYQVASMSVTVSSRALNVFIARLLILMFSSGGKKKTNINSVQQVGVQDINVPVIGKDR